MSYQPFSNPEDARRFVDACLDFEDALRNGLRPSIDEELAKWPESVRSYVRKDLLELERHHRQGSVRTPIDSSQAKKQRASDYSTIGSSNSSPSTASWDHPEKIGRYRVTKILGEGSFGRVYLAYDDDLNRSVAIKVPLSERVSLPDDIEAYLAEARTLASLNHPHIISVFDVGRIENGLCFVVSKFVEGTDLAKLLKQSWPSSAESARLVATVAEALHHAHLHGLVHRDVKPANILIDATGIPILADFGLAMKDVDFGKGTGFAGTPAYMSPEQAKGEGHRVDGRSDIFSLGVVFYELLTKKRPFKSEIPNELLEQIANFEAKPPRQIDDTVPKELERICLKALSKRAADRYTAAKDMADDLMHFLGEQSGKNLPVAIKDAAVPSSVTSPSASPPRSDNKPIKIVPKGLRSFDAHDADFFLELLPGPRDRDGLPDAIRFWKTQIEDTDSDNSFSVGLIYGPSGCGKSSLVKAGLLPRLSDDILAVYVEATAEETETRLLNGLRKRCPLLAHNLSLKEALASLRREQRIPAGKKVLIVLDQFEQWLHAKKQEQNTELVQALRQCDGEWLKCVVMVRDDFWMAATRFMRELEVRLVEARNSAAVDLFDLDHARKVLAAFGRAFGKLPEKPSEITKDQKQFLEQAMSDFAQEGKVISVRLSLFAEMMKTKTWTPAALKAVGGTEGVGVTFLEETFSATAAPPEHRYHQKAARAVLKALLPESGTDIKGHMRSREELLNSSGYSNRPKDFDDLIQILDAEIRLLTPTDPEGKAGEEPSTKVQSGPKYYQLTHDYLVPSLRDWLTRKQKETRRGRAELVLAERATVWNTRPENRQLPSILQWFQIKWLTSTKSWSPPQRKMMRQATQYYVVRGGLLVLLLAVGTFTSFAIREQAEQRQKSAHAAGLVQQLLKADFVQVPAIIADISGYRQWADRLLHQEYDKAAPKSREKLLASLALLPVDSGQVNYLYERLLDAEPHEVTVVIESLAPNKDQLLERLWQVAETPARGKESQRLRAASALAKYDPNHDKWAKVNVAVTNDFVAVPAVHLAMWMKPLRDVRKALSAPLSAVFRDPVRRDVERSLATDILADFVADQPLALADLLMDADAKQFSDLYPIFQERDEEGMAGFTAEIDRTLPPDLPSSDERREDLAKRQANAAVALLRMNQPEKVWPLLKHSTDPRVRSYLIHRFSPLGADAAAIVKRLGEETDLTIRRALLLSLGSFSDKQLPSEVRKVLLPTLRKMYRTDLDPGLHASAEWLLRTWKEEAWLKQVNEEWAKDIVWQEKRLDRIKQSLTMKKEKAPPQWYVNGQGQTMVTISGQVEFEMGSPATEPDRRDDERQHKKRIGRTFAIAAKAVTMEQYRKFDERYRISEKYHRTADLPVVGTLWHQAADYCNWLSKREKIEKDEWCYEEDATGKVTKLKANYLSLRGYRLPTEAEMEYAIRAGALTSRFFGETDELLSNYAWYTKNSMKMTWPVGSLKPNDLGLFDVQGNSFTWCQESYLDYRVQVADDVEDELVVSTAGRVLRGGAFTTQSSLLRSADRSYLVPATRHYSVGFRPARTLMTAPANGRT